MDLKDSGLTAIDIKKLVYRQQPVAKFEKIRIGVAYYTFNVLWREVTRLGFSFEIPIEDMGTADFYKEMEAKHLLQWLNSENILYLQPITEEL